MKTRNNHYVPQWYQRGFLLNRINKLHYLDLNPGKKKLPDGRIVTMNNIGVRSTSQCFYQTDLYTTFFGEYINDEIERRLFGEIDDSGSMAIRAFIGEDVSKWHQFFSDFFSYIDSQKIRTPKGLDWIKSHYPDLNQLELMIEMQSIRNLHCTVWSEGVREIVSAKNSTVKFIITDHPVTVYNSAFSPENKQCNYPDDPSIVLKGTQTIFPLDMEHCLILTNYEYAKDPEKQDPIEKRINASLFRNSMVRTDAFIRTRFLNDDEVKTINFILKNRARRYVAAPNKDWLYPEKYITNVWSELKAVLLPPKDELWHFGGEMFVKYQDGTIYYQDAFGRTTPENKYLKKREKKENIGRNDPCGCGSGKKFKKCCMNKSEKKRPSWQVISIRERNLALFNGVNDILGLNKRKTWDDVRRELSDSQVKEIHELYEFLWPTDTDIFTLLPSPDNTLRALYTGLVDPRVISMSVLGITPYFDEIIIQNPFVHPAFVNPKFSPTKSPHQHKQQTLKNVLLLQILTPFINAGFVNFIPDPCSFNLHLRRQMMKMAENRLQNFEMPDEEADMLTKIHKDDFERAIYMLPKEHRKNYIARAMPSLSDEQVEKLLQYIDKKTMKDPLTLLQNNLVDGQDGQLLVMSMAPNFELAFYLSQVTGSLLLTDSLSRWKEINGVHKDYDSPWVALSTLFNNFDYVINANPEVSFSQRKKGSFGNFRNAFRNIYAAVLEGKSDSSAFFVERLRNDLEKGLEIIKKNGLTPNRFNFNIKINCLIPKGGFVHNNVQRMLLTTGSRGHLKCVPMALYIKRN